MEQQQQETLKCCRALKLPGQNLVKICCSLKFKYLSATLTGPLDHNLLGTSSLDSHLDRLWNKVVAKVRKKAAVAQGVVVEFSAILHCLLKSDLVASHTFLCHRLQSKGISFEHLLGLG